jgi:hypothetical protein
VIRIRAIVLPPTTKRSAVAVTSPADKFDQHLDGEAVRNHKRLSAPVAQEANRSSTRRRSGLGDAGPDVEIMAAYSGAAAPALARPLPRSRV